MSSAPPQRETEAFGQVRALHLTERAPQRMRDEGSPYDDVVEGRLSGQPQNPDTLWNARKKLAAHIRREVACICAAPVEVEEEPR